MDEIFDHIMIHGMPECLLAFAFGMDARASSFCEQPLSLMDLTVRMDAILAVCVQELRKNNERDETIYVMYDLQRKLGNSALVFAWMRSLLKDHDFSAQAGDWRTGPNADQGRMRAESVLKRLGMYFVCGDNLYTAFAFLLGFRQGEARNRKINLTQECSFEKLIEADDESFERYYRSLYYDFLVYPENALPSFLRHCFPEEEVKYQEMQKARAEAYARHLEEEKRRGRRE